MVFFIKRFNFFPIIGRFKTLHTGVQIRLWEDLETYTLPSACRAYLEENKENPETIFEIKYYMAEQLRPHIKENIFKLTSVKKSDYFFAYIENDYLYCEYEVYQNIYLFTEKSSFTSKYNLLDEKYD